MDETTETRSRKETAKKPKDPPILIWLRTIKNMFSFIGSFLVIGGVALGIFLLYLRAQSLPVSSVTQTSEILDSQGALIDSFNSGQNRQLIALKDISPWVIKATLAIEDHRFYEHMGFDPTGLARAVMTDIKTMSMEQGASTITQQLARNLYLNQERTLQRKLKEAMYTVQLEMQLSKDQILEQYLNHIYYGFSTYGIEAASEMYFGKSAKNLGLAESALIAGIPKGPKYYSPYLSLNNARDRQKLILDAMTRYGDITQAQEDEALKEKLTIVPHKQEQPAEAPFFRDYVRSLAAEKLGITEAQFNSSGYRVITTLDLHAQKIAEDVFAGKLKNTGDLQAALFAIDPRNGHVKAMVGGKDYNQNQFNRVFATTRQPGSSFKPFVYLTALQQGYTPVSRFKSQPTTFTYDNGRQTYTPSNFAGHYFGDIDLREAISKSDNIFAVHTILDVGPDKVVDMAKKMGVTSPLKPLPALALGAFPVSPFEMASAYGIIANLGVRVEPTSILRIETSSGKVLYEAKPKEEKVVDPSYTYVLANLMTSVFDEGGTGFRVSDLMKRPVAGKTGSTDTDAWMVGFTPELSVAVWVGHDRDEKISATESYKAAPIFAEFMEGALEAVPPKLFEMPAGIDSVYIDPATGKLANDACPNSRLEAFVSGTAPIEYCADSKNTGKKQDTPKQGKSWWNDLKRWWND